VENAVQLTRSTKCSSSYAAKQFNIPPMTFRRHLAKYDDPNKRKWTVFTIDKERHIVNWILERTFSSPVTCEELRNYGTYYAKVKE
jgi:hypothetical protein